MANYTAGLTAALTSESVSTKIKSYSQLSTLKSVITYTGAQTDFNNRFGINCTTFNWCACGGRFKTV